MSVLNRSSKSSAHSDHLVQAKNKIKQISGEFVSAKVSTPPPPTKKMMKGFIRQWAYLNVFVFMIYMSFCGVLSISVCRVVILVTNIVFHRGDVIILRFLTL